MRLWDRGLWVRGLWDGNYRMAGLWDGIPKSPLLHFSLCEMDVDACTNDMIVTFFAGDLSHLLHFSLHQ